MKYKYVKINIPPPIENEYSFEIVKGIKPNMNSLAIVVSSLDPEYTLYLGNIHLIISKNGSSLAHLSLVANDYNIPIIRCETMELDKIKNKTKVIIHKNTIEFL